MRRSQHPAVRTWHVFTRGARRLALFYEEADYRQFLLFLREALILSGCEIFAYALMGNHYHLMLRGTQSQISVCMQRLNWRYALYHNDRHRMGGHVFDGPYQSFPQRSLKWLLWRIAYIFLNPVQANLAVKAEDYPWSGFRSFMGQSGSPLEVAPLPELNIRTDLGDAKTCFLEMMDEQLANGKTKGSATPTAREIQAEQFDWVLRQAAPRAALLPGVDPLDLALLWGQESGIPPTVMAERARLASRHAVRRRIERVKRRLGDDSHAKLASL